MRLVITPRCMIRPLVVPLSSVLAQLRTHFKGFDVGFQILAWN